MDLGDVTHGGDGDLIGLGVPRRRGRGRDLRPRAVQVLDALLVVRAERQGVGEGVVGGHDGPGLPGVLQTQHVAKLMGSHLEEVRAWGGGGGRGFGVHMVSITQLNRSASVRIWVQLVVSRGLTTHRSPKGLLTFM